MKSAALPFLLTLAFLLSHCTPTQSSNPIPVIAHTAGSQFWDLVPSPSGRLGQTPQLTLGSPVANADLVRQRGSSGRWGGWGRGDSASSSPPLPGGSRSPTPLLQPRPHLHLASPPQAPVCLLGMLPAPPASLPLSFIPHLSVNTSHSPMQPSSACHFVPVFVLDPNPSAPAASTANRGPDRLNPDLSPFPVPPARSRQSPAPCAAWSPLPCSSHPPASPGKEPVLLLPLLQMKAQAS